MSDFDWTPERIEKLKRAWAAGLPTSAIAALIGDGCTKNAVVGKAHRLDLDRRDSPITGTALRKPRTRSPEEMQRLAARREQAKHEQRRRTQAGEPVRPYDIRPGFTCSPAPIWLKTCQWIEDDPQAWRPHAGSAPTGELIDAMKCNRPAAPGQPYCEDHCARACVRHRNKEAA